MIDQYLPEPLPSTLRRGDLALVVPLDLGPNTWISTELLVKPLIQKLLVQSILLRNVVHDEPNVLDEVLHVLQFIRYQWDIS